MKCVRFWYTLQVSQSIRINTQQDIMIKRVQPRFLFFIAGGALAILICWYLLRTFETSSTQRAHANSNVINTYQIRGVVTLPNGQPASRALVGATGSSTWLQVENGETFRQPSAETDEAGAFVADARSRTGSDGGFSVVALHDEGFGYVTITSSDEAATITLAPWGSVELTARFGDDPLSNGKAGLWMYHGIDFPHGAVAADYKGTLNDKGQIRFDRVIPGFLKKWRLVNVGDNEQRWYDGYIEVKPGETTVASIGGDGRRVAGTVKVPEIEGVTIEPGDVTGDLIINADPPPVPEGLSQEEEIAWYTEWQASEEGRRHAYIGRSYSFRIPPDGRYLFDDVLPGDYWLRIQLHKRRQGSGYYDTLASSNSNVTVPANDESADEAFDLGLSAMIVHEDLDPGEKAPALVYTTFDGEEKTLADLRGNVVLLDFWATWCGPCIEATPDLKALYERYKHHDDFTLLALSLDTEVEKPKKYVEENEITWTQGFLGSWSETTAPERFGVQGIPSLILIDAEGTVIARGHVAAQIEDALEEALD